MEKKAEPARYPTAEDPRWKEVEDLKSELGWPTTGKRARKWWNEFEIMYLDRPELVHQVLTEIERRDSSIQEFIMALVYGGIDNFQATFDFLDYVKKSVSDRSLTIEDFIELKDTFIS